MSVLRVALPLPLEPMSFAAPHGNLRNPIGHRIAVPWRNEIRTGIVVSTEESAQAFAVREAIGFLDETPWFDSDSLNFLQEAAKDSFCPMGTILRDLVPFLESPFHHYVRLVENAPLSAIPLGLELTHTQWQSTDSMDLKLLDQLRDGGLLEEKLELISHTKKILVVLNEDDTALTPKGKIAMRTLLDFGQAQSFAELARMSGVGPAVIKKVFNAGNIGWREIEEVPPEKTFVNFPKQTIERVPQRLHGGKLLERIKWLANLALQEKLLVLFPEVSLLKKFEAFFAGAEVLHGELNAEQRVKTASRLANATENYTLLCTHQGLAMSNKFDRLVVVEEGSESFNLAAGSRVWIPRLAQLKANLLGKPLLNISAVSSVEIAEQNCLELPFPVPRFHLLDPKQEPGWPLTGAAVAVLKQVAEKGRQAIVLSSRRGYSAVLRCKACDWKSMCPNCTLPLRFHQSGRFGVLLCHQCGHEQNAPSICPSCQSDIFEPKGPGVEWLWEMIGKLIPELHRYRYTATEKDDLTPLLKGQSGVLVGTTAILRGPTLPELAVVVVPYADGFLQDSDFRAQEKYHRFIRQVADLHPGRNPLIVLQTFEPSNPVYKICATGAVQDFLEKELQMRKILNYPPYTRIIKFEISHPKEASARETAFQLSALLELRAKPGELLGPAPAPVARIRGQYIFHLLLKGTHSRLGELLENISLPRGARIRLEPDPHSFVGLLDD